MSSSADVDRQPAAPAATCRADALRLRGVGIDGGSGYRSDVFALRNVGRRPCRVTRLQASFDAGSRTMLGTPSPRPGVLRDERTNAMTRAGVLPPGDSVRLRFGYVVAPGYRGHCRPEPAGDEIVAVNDVHFASPIDWFEVCTTPSAAPWISWHVGKPQQPWPENARQPRQL